MEESPLRAKVRLSFEDITKAVVRMWPTFPLTVILVLQVSATKAFIRAVCRHNSTALDFKALPALFGPPVPAKGLVGFLVEAHPADACRPIDGPPNASFAFIALIRRYNCSFATKVFHAQLVGFRAAIIHNVCSQNLVNMVSEASYGHRIRVPSVFTAEVASKILKQLHRAGKLTQVILVPGYFHFPSRSSSGVGRRSSGSPPCCCHIQHSRPCTSQTISFYVCWMICIPGSALIASLLIEKYLSRSQRWKLRKSQRVLEGGQRWASMALNASKYQECAICLEPYAEYDSLKVLSCTHAFHSRCIDLWHITQPRSKTCPLCMQKVKVVVRLHAVRLCKDKARENTWRMLISKSRSSSEGHRPLLMLSQQYSSHY